MLITGNTILVTGGGSGIGRGLAEAFLAAGNQVLIAGRREAALERTATASPGIEIELLDVENAAGIQDFATRVTKRHPALNVLINNAGIMRAEDLLAGHVDIADAEATIATNLLGPMRLVQAFLPHLREQPRAAIINVSSGLAFVPLASAPTYSATKAAIHSYTQSLRFQLRSTSVEVIELVPPSVATGIMPGQAANPRTMALADFIAESMALLRATPSATEICVDRVKPLREAEAAGRFDEVFGMVNSG